MKYDIQRFDDPAFFKWLDGLDPSRTGSKCGFNKAVIMGYVAMDALATWADDRFYSVPDGMGNISMMSYFMTSEGKRLFVAFIYGSNYGSNNRAVLMEITTLQLLVAPLGVRTPTGRKIMVPLVPSIGAPNDKKPLRNAMINPSEESFIGVREEEDVNFLINVKQQTTEDKPPEIKTYLKVEIGHPALAMSTVNHNLELASLAVTGGNP